MANRERGFPGVAQSKCEIWFEREVVKDVVGRGGSFGGNGGEDVGGGLGKSGGFGVGDGVGGEAGGDIDDGGGGVEGEGGVSGSSLLLAMMEALVLEKVVLVLVLVLEEVMVVGWRWRQRQSK
ncbi:glycine-rich cell wall structural protein-like [Pistacia vera]|uniref:glycine-rich cell wall structural protein-like n=1 Tax=Pistacia vera TaxID=55513 RepID=UPI0012631494|nr:glycine-rich cell wall structural protein-like [Pistacia vera]